MPRPEDIPSNPDHAFEEPWHAQLFAVTHAMSTKGHFEWSDWADHFANELRRADESGAPKDGSAYYDIWLGAFESFLVERGIADAETLTALKQSWTDAYLNTPHGEPVELGG